MTGIRQEPTRCIPFRGCLLYSKSSRLNVSVLGRCPLYRASKKMTEDHRNPPPYGESKKMALQIISGQLKVPVPHFEKSSPFASFLGPTSLQAFISEITRNFSVL